MITDGRQNPPRRRNGSADAAEQSATSERSRRPRWLARLFWRIAGLVALIGVVAILLAIFIPKIREATRLEISVPDSLQQLLPDEQMGYAAIDFQEAILGETREKTELVVLERDVQVSTEISHTLANISLFEKSQTLISYGTGVYTVDLSGLRAKNIVFDPDARIVSVTIPRAKLTYVNFDVNKTEFSETRRAIFGFGVIKLTTEQMTLLESSIEQTMREALDTPEALAAADERALIAVRELLEPLVKAVSDNECFLKVLIG